MFSHVPGSRASVCIAITSEDLNKECPLVFSFLLDFIVEQTSNGMKYPFGQLGTAVLTISPLNLLPMHSQLAF